MTERFAAAKLNLCLHVTGYRSDGYHELDSLVVHVDQGDWIIVEPADDLSLSVSGAFCEGIPADGRNLVLKAAHLLAKQIGEPVGAKILLIKNLPSAAGIGGGSSDAAATLHLLSSLWNIAVPDLDGLSKLGADVPVSMSPELSRMEGIGERLTHLGDPPVLNFLLINPGVDLPTPKVFAALTEKFNAPLPKELPELHSSEDWIDWLIMQRNDLEAPATDLRPIVGEVLSALRDWPSAKLARMSGSGATCFALFSSWADAQEAEAHFAKTQPNWWVRAARTWNGKDQVSRSTT